MKKRLVLTGASGKLGSTLINFLNKEYNLFPIGNKNKPKNGYKLDLTNNNKVENFLNKIKPEIIIHLVAITKVDFCEENFNKAHEINFLTTKNLVDWSEKKKIRFIYLSTDQLYDNSNLSDEKSANPKNFYAITKFLSEGVVLSLKNSLVVRTNFYGFFPKHKDSLIDWFINEIKEKRQVSLIKDIFFNPVYVKHLCDYIVKLIKARKAHGIVNLGAKNSISKGMFLYKVAKELNLKKFKSKFTNVKNIKLKAYRPKNMSMSVKKIENIFNKPMPTIEDGIFYLVNDLKSCNEF